MTVYLLGDALVFPPPEDAEPDGLLAIGGDLRAERLRLAYRSGIFPWFGEGDPIAWYSPDPRLVLRPSELRVNRSLARTLRHHGFRLSMDEAFDRVVERCATVERAHESGTWITPAMRDAYGRLHQDGDAHSLEVWDEQDELVGGLYGIGVGRCFSGESMFSLVSDASKIAFVALTRQLEAWSFALIDCQLPADHLASLGGVEWPRKRFLDCWRAGTSEPARRGRWTLTPGV